ncbi:MAG: hypothetical protein CFE32_20810 [Alphaproteobacteria bacterium PA3]|nr:MAG: hypothetical protein CFE32_20810 [Alphaproteobacteria bacterium PA3]
MGQRLGQRLAGDRFMHHQVEGEGDELRERDEVLQRVVAEGLADVRHVGQGRRGGQVDRVAVGRRAQQLLRGQRAIGAGPGFHVHRLLQRHLQVGGQAAGDHVGGAARGEGREDADRLARPGGLGGGQHRPGGQGGGGQQQLAALGLVGHRCSSGGWPGFDADCFGAAGQGHPGQPVRCAGPAAQPDRTRPRPFGRLSWADWRTHR